MWPGRRSSKRAPSSLSCLPSSARERDDAAGNIASLIPERWIRTAWELLDEHLSHRGVHRHEAAERRFEAALSGLIDEQLAERHRREIFDDRRARDRTGVRLAGVGARYASADVAVGALGQADRVGSV